MFIIKTLLVTSDVYLEQQFNTESWLMRLTYVKTEGFVGEITNFQQASNVDSQSREDVEKSDEIEIINVSNIIITIVF